VRVTGLARRYAKAVFDVAQEHGRGEPENWQAQLHGLAATLSDAALLESLRSPRLTDEQKARAVESSFPGLRPEFRNLVHLLVARHRIQLLGQISAAFDEYVDEMLGRTHADVVSARPLGREELTLIQDTLNRRTGLEVRVRSSIDENIIGGVVIRLGDQLIDASVVTRLERLRQQLA